MKNKILKSFKKWPWAGPVILAFFTRLYRLTSGSSIWHDEGYTMWLVQYNPLEIIARDIRDVHPPGYYLLLKPWIEIFGSSAFSARFFSLIFSVGIVFLVYKIVERIFTPRAALFASLFVALSPFMIRFGQEARMYGVVAFFTTLATYFLVKFIYDKNKNNLVFYAISMIFAVYTQYYAFFVVFAHWAIIAMATPNFFKFKWKESFRERIMVFDPYWWGANLLILLFYLPWFGVAYRQVTRISDNYWIKPEWITEKTIPENILQFVFYSHLNDLSQGEVILKLLFWILVTLLVSSGFWLFKKKNLTWPVLALYIFGYLPMILVFTLSKLRTPIYQDRYFPFSAVALFVIWGVSIAYIEKKNLRRLLLAGFILMLIIGNLNMHKGVNHKMKQLSEVVTSQSQESDLILSGELYTFLDGAYYLGYDRLKLLSDGVDGWGETSLFYDMQSDYLFNPTKTDDLPTRTWLIGKSGKSYFEAERWTDFSEITYFEEDGLRATLYTRK